MCYKLAMPNCNLLFSCFRTILLQFYCTQSQDKCTISPDTCAHDLEQTEMLSANEQTAHPFSICAELHQSHMRVDYRKAIVNEMLAFIGDSQSDLQLSYT